MQLAQQAAASSISSPMHVAYTHISADGLPQFKHCSMQQVKFIVGWRALALVLMSCNPE